MTAFYNTSDTTSSTWPTTYSTTTTYTITASFYSFATNAILVYTPPKHPTRQPKPRIIHAAPAPGHASRPPAAPARWATSVRAFAGR